MRKKPETAAMFVPEAEQPYQIPYNWRWVRLGDISSAQYGYTAKAITDNSYPKMLRITDIQEGNVNWSEVPNCKISDADFEKYSLNHEDIVIARIGATTGKSYLLKNPPFSAFASYLIRLRLSANTQAPYVYYFLQSDLYWKQISELSVGIALPGVNSSKLKTMLFPLPPPAEQQRIVDRIESLFSKLDAAWDNAQAVLDGFELRKAAILYRAFSGELTEQWRKNNGVSLDNWTRRGFELCVQKMQNGLAKRKGMTGNPVVVLRLANLSDEGFLTDDLRKIVLDEKEQSLYLLNPGDVLMIRVNGSKENVGKQFLITNQNAWSFCDHIIRIKYSHDIQPEYMTFFSKSETYKQYVKSHIVSSAGQNTISRRAMADLLIPVPTMEEQSEIVRLLSGIFTKEEEVKATAQQVIDHIDAMKKAILGRAFRGELGTNDPSEESPDFAVTV